MWNRALSDDEGRPATAATRILVFAPDARTMKWIEEELAGERVVVQVARTTRDIVRALTQDPPPHPQILVADLDAMSASDVLGLHAIRDRGWFGSLIALGDVPDDLRGTLNIAYVLVRPLGSEGLRKAVTQIGADKATTKMPKLVRP